VLQPIDVALSLAVLTCMCEAPDGLIIVVSQMESATVECPELHSGIVRMAMTLKGNRTAPSQASVMLSVLS
jgi:hypothetical protein